MVQTGGLPAQPVIEEPSRIKEQINVLVLLRPVFIEDGLANVGRDFPVYFPVIVAGEKLPQLPKFPSRIAEFPVVDGCGRSAGENPPQVVI